MPLKPSPAGGREKRTLINLLFRPAPWVVANGWLAIFMVLLVVGLSGLEAAYAQVNTTNRIISPELFSDKSFLLLLCLDILVPLTIALLSKWAFVFYLTAQCFLSCILLHYRIFFYNTLTLSTIYHSLQGAASLGIDIFGFARPEIIVILGLLLLLKLFLVQISMAPRPRMPKVFQLRGLSAVAAMTVICWVVMIIYGKTGLTQHWVDFKGHRPAVERRLEEGARESVRNIGYVATWFGELISGTYSDTSLIYAEVSCPDPDGKSCLEGAEDEGKNWMGLPLPPLPSQVIMIQAESLDYAALDLRVNGLEVIPFLNGLARQSLLLRAFAPHKVGSCNSDYEILNSRIAEQNVLYYSYIKEYPDSVIRPLAEKGYRPAVFHGLGGGLFNLREAYEAQAFEEFHFKEDLLEEGYQPGPYIMEHILDEDLFRSAAGHLSDEVPKAQFIITMTSHVPFIPARPEFKSVGGSFARYVSSLNYLDRTLAEFYQKLPEGTLVVIWGDHGSDVDYPRGFVPGDRHVPFLVHVKGNDEWLKGLGQLATKELLSGRKPSADGRVHSLCQLSHYLRCLFK